MPRGPRRVEVLGSDVHGFLARHGFMGLGTISPSFGFGASRPPLYIPTYNTPFVGQVIQESFRGTTYLYATFADVTQASFRGDVLELDPETTAQITLAPYSVVLQAPMPARAVGTQDLWTSIAPAWGLLGTVSTAPLVATIKQESAMMAVVTAPVPFTAAVVVVSWRLE